MALGAVSGLAVGDFLDVASLFVGDFCLISFSYGTLGWAFVGSMVGLCFALYFNYKFARRLLIFYEGCFVADFDAPAPPVVVFFGLDFM